jgi:hypothetical protein
MKIIANVCLNTEISQVQINPFQSHQLAVVGNDYFKLVKVKENSFYIQPNVQNLNQNQNFTDLAWYDSQQLILTNDKGEVAFI